MDHSLFVHSPTTEGHNGYFQVLAIMNKATVNIWGQVLSRELDNILTHTTIIHIIKRYMNKYLYTFISIPIPISISLSTHLYVKFFISYFHAQIYEFFVVVYNFYFLN